MTCWYCAHNWDSRCDCPECRAVRQDFPDEQHYHHKDEPFAPSLSPASDD